MLSTLKVMRERFGGPEGYVIEKCGLTEEDLMKIRKHLTVKEVAIHERPGKII